MMIIFKQRRHLPGHPAVPVVARTHRLQGQGARIKTEEKAKVVASVWGTEFIQFLAAPAILPRTIWDKKVEFIRFF